MKKTGMLVVSLRGVNFGFWSHCMSYLCVFKRSLLGVKMCLSHAQIGLL